MQKINNIGAIFNMYLTMEAWVPSASKHVNVGQIIPVCGRRISIYTIGWPIRCNNRAVVANILDEATNVHEQNLSAFFQCRFIPHSFIYSLCFVYFLLNMPHVALVDL